jgi:Leucine-rich repeat (LRR) protein
MHFKEYLKQYPTPEKRRELTELSLEKIDLSDEIKVLDAFNGLENLTWLELLTNKKPNKHVTRLPPHIFDNLEKLQKLYMENLKLTELNADIFINMPLLNEIVLEYNYFSSLPENLFQNQTNLQKLKIRNVFDIYMGFSLPSKIFQPVKETLTSLELDGNSIRKLPDDIFFGLTNLKKLDLAGNEIQDLHPNIFKDLNSLERLNLNQNELTLPLPVFEWPMFNEDRLPEVSASRQNIPINASANPAAGGKRKRRRTQKKRRRTQKKKQPFKKRLDQNTTFKKKPLKNNLLKKGWTKTQSFKKS